MLPLSNCVQLSHVEIPTQVSLVRGVLFLYHKSFCFNILCQTQSVHNMGSKERECQRRIGDGGPRDGGPPHLRSSFHVTMKMWLHRLIAEVLIWVSEMSCHLRAGHPHA